MRLFVIARHGESILNRDRRVNGDPLVPVPLSAQGEEESRFLGVQLAHLPLEACVVTRFARTRETAELALAGREVPVVVEPLLDDIDVGSLEGVSIEEYRAWKRAHDRREPFPDGESLDAAARRYARGFRRLLAGTHSCVLVICHEIPLRYILNGAAGSAELDGPLRQLGNAIPYLLDGLALERGAARIEVLAG